MGNNTITLKDFKKVNIIVGKILSAEKIPDTDKLEKPRQIVSGISLYFPDCNILIGRKCMFVTNLEPRIIREIESQGMILAVSAQDGRFSLLEPSDEIPVGTRAN
ncbi:MAG: Methionyl-tRNA synthetase [Candidatus Nomurabacteria bacterium GW2011_GWF2_35_12]|nr:MAG: Methionyl-tRNA synthetase [Candidatus Nomurabacteria bacterium GW2011_GWF2_35_12]